MKTYRIYIKINLIQWNLMNIAIYSSKYVKKKCSYFSCRYIFKHTCSNDKDNVFFFGVDSCTFKLFYWFKNIIYKTGSEK